MNPRKIATALLASSLLLLAGCGSDDEPKGADDSGAPSVDLGDGSLPACSDVWKAGKTLPEDFAGCDDDGTVVDLTYTECKDGTRMYVHRAADGSTKTHIAITGTEIKDWTEELDASTYATCQPA